MNQLKTLIQNFVATLHNYDYIMFAISGALFFLILLLAIIFRKKVGLSLFLILLSFVIIIAGPIFSYNYIHSTMFKAEISNLQIKELEFSEALVVKGTLTNFGTKDLKKCSIDLKAYKGAHNFLEELVYPLKPFKKMSILKQEQIDRNSSIKFKMILEPFTYSKEYNISIKATCL